MNETSHRTVRQGFGFGSLFLAAVASAALATGVVLYLKSPPTQAPDAAAAPTPAVSLYHCPMHPTIVQDHPGDCPICGMRLVLASPGAAAEPARSTDAAQAETAAGLATVEIDPARQQLIGLETTAASIGPVGGSWRTVGRVAIDETRVRHVNLKVPAFVERIFVDFVGKTVQRGDPLFSVYSPELLAAQEEFLLARRTRDAMAAAGAASEGDVLVEAARRKLMLWDVPARDIDAIARSGKPARTLTLYSPVAGVVTKKDVVEGMKLDAGAMPYEIVDLSSVWVLADVYETELRYVREGMAATLQLNAFPDRPFPGQVVFIDPLLDPTTRTVKVRLTFANPTGELRPEMYGEVVLQSPPRDGLRIPADAVIDSGTETMVFVAVGAGKFQPRRVKLGGGDGTHVEVVAGLEADERVVTRANFLVDSESRLRASLAAMTGASPADSARVLPPVAGEEAAPAAHQHGGR